MLTVIIPVSAKDYSLIDDCLANIGTNIKNCGDSIEVMLAVNGDRISAQMDCARKARGETLVFTDVDNKISQNFLKEVNEKSKNPYFVGGGVKYLIPSRMSFGIFCFSIPLIFFLFITRATCGAFWVKKDDFFAMGGFKDNIKYYDIDFSLRLKKYAKKQHRKFESIKENFLIWSTRKFDEYGDWHWIKGYHSKSY